MFDSAASSRSETMTHTICHAPPVSIAPPPAITSPPRPQPSVLSDLVGPTPTSPVSTTSAFLLGIHNYKALDDINLPEFVKEHQATLTFPEKLMLLLTYVDQEYKTKGANADNTSISWILDGRAFIIRSKEDVVKHLLPMFFRQAKFASFTRKLYRWGFRQVSVAQERSSSNRREMIFGHEFFQRDNKSLMARMRSVTAAGTRRAIASMSVKPKGSDGQEKIAIEPKKTEGQPLPPQLILAAPPAALAPGAAPYPQFVGKMLYPIQQEGGAPGPNPFAVPTMGHSLSEALALSHQQRALAAVQPPVAPTKEGGGSTAAPPSTEKNKQGAPAAAPPPVLPYETFPHLMNTNMGLAATQAVAATQERIRTNQEQASGGKAAESADPNAYMRAAVDMLLRYAS